MFQCPISLTLSLLFYWTGDSDFSIDFPRVIFRSDENIAYDGSSSIFIGITDDAIDEMNEEFFVLTLQLDSPIDDRIHIIGNTSIGVIIDNDGRFIKILLMCTCVCFGVFCFSNSLILNVFSL